MTIQRLYSLPNCTLILEGLSEDGASRLTYGDVRPLLSTLLQVKCYLAKSLEPLSGDREFFEHLVKAVDSYAQEFLATVNQPVASTPEPGFVQLYKVDHNCHRLIVQGRLSEQGLAVVETSRQQPIQIDLTTVELFDLVEAVDQFLTDRQTLPNFPRQLLPFTTPMRKSSFVLVKQAVPALMGVYSLTFAAIALFLVPIPAQVGSLQHKSQSNLSLKLPNNNLLKPKRSYPSLTLSPAPVEAALDATHITSADITNSHQLRVLNRKLYDQLHQAWQSQSKINQNLIYRVAVAADGRLLGYKPVNGAARTHINQTPLAHWQFNSSQVRTVNPQQLAQFRVVFSRNRVLQVSPWWGYRITDSGQHQYYHRY